MNRSWSNASAYSINWRIDAQQVYDLAMSEAFTDDQLTMLWEDAYNSIYLVGQWLNSAAMWQIIGASLGILIVSSLVALIIGRAYGAVGFRARD